MSVSESHVSTRMVSSSPTDGGLQRAMRLHGALVICFAAARAQEVVVSVPDAASLGSITGECILGNVRSAHSKATFYSATAAHVLFSRTLVRTVSGAGTARWNAEYAAARDRRQH